MVLFGLAAGIGTNSALCLMLDLTLPQAAGTFVGVWGLAQALSRAVGKLLGGGLYDIGRALPLGEGAYGAFALVLGTELLVALAALLLLSRVNLREFRKENTCRSLSRVLAMELGFNLAPGRQLLDPRLEALIDRVAEHQRANLALRPRTQGGWIDHHGLRSLEQRHLGGRGQLATLASRAKAC